MYGPGSQSEYPKRGGTYRAKIEPSQKVRKKKFPVSKTSGGAKKPRRRRRYSPQVIRLLGSANRRG